MIPKLYLENEVEFTSNGVGVLKETTISRVTEVLNDRFELYLEYPATGRHALELKEFRYLIAKPNNVDDPHIFKIYEIDKETDPSIVRVYAHSKNFELGSNYVKKLQLDETDPKRALEFIENNLLYPTDIKLYTNIINKKKDILWEHRNPLNCLIGQEGSIVHLFGGEIKHENKKLSVLNRRGSNKGYILSEGKNIEGFRQNVSVKGLTTVIVPYARTYDPDTGKEVLLEGSIVKSSKVDKYPMPFVRSVDLSDEEIETVADLNKKAERYFTSLYKEVDTPKVELSINVYDYRRTFDGNKVVGFEQLEVGDTVRTWVERYDIFTDVRITEIVYDSLSETVISIKAGSRSTTSTMFQNSRYQSLIDNIGNRINSATNVAMASANGNNKTFIGSDLPTKGMKEGDGFFRNLSNGKSEFYVYDGEEWQIMLYPEMNDELEKALAELRDKYDLFENDVREIREYQDRKLQEFEDTISEFDPDLIRRMRQDISETSEQVEIHTRLIGDPGTPTYSRNRTTVTDGLSKFTEDGIYIQHDGDGFQAGDTITISFEAECIELEKGTVTFDVRTNAY